MVGSTIIHHNKSADAYESAMRSIAKKCDLENKNETYIVKDGELALIAACLKSLRKFSLPRCTRYSEAISKDFVTGMGIKGNMKDAMFDVAFGEHGLVEAENKQDLTL